ncbi:MAG: hypothetical protein LBV80_05145 [Deltaproteobacteria bacterium]|jgi:hypothetical protein|nr:hypothetical protein [Deltaproteobacteria bacterium]
MEWLSLFNADGIVKKLLKDDDILLLVEDTELRIGEKANAHGFFVLDTPELRKLFTIKENDNDFA